MCLRAEQANSQIEAVAANYSKHIRDAPDDPDYPFEVSGQLALI